MKQIQTLIDARALFAGIAANYGIRDDGSNVINFKEALGYLDAVIAEPEAAPVATAPTVEPAPALDLSGITARLGNIESALIKLLPTTPVA